MNQEIKANNVPMLLAAIGRWFLHVFIPGIKIDSIEVITANGPSEGINSGFANCLANRVACASGRRVAIKRKSSVSRLANAA